MTALSFETVDAFTTTAFSGNPAAVIVLDPADPRVEDTALFLSIAAEFNLSETAIIVPLPATEEHAHRFSLRWFTPAVEVKLCGHATLASSHVLFKKFPHAASLAFVTRQSGTLIASKLPSGKIQLDFPADPTALVAYERPGEERWEAAVKGAVAAAPDVRGKVVGVGWTESLGCIVEVEAVVDLPGLKVDAAQLLIHGPGFLTITQRSLDPRFDILSRVFAPNMGVSEDPVTGAAHCVLAPYWLGSSARARLPENISSTSTAMTLRAKQVSARGGELEVTFHPGTGRVFLAGSAVTTMSGSLLV